MDETYIKVNGVWKYLYGRSTETVTRLTFCSLPESITIDKRDAKAAAINRVIADSGVDILVRQCKCLDNIVEQDHRAIKGSPDR